MQIGRQEFEDSRQWLYDNELDGIRLSYMTARLHVEAFFARVATVDKGLINVRGQDKTDYYQLLVEYRFIPRLTFSTYMLAQNDNLPMGKRPLFVGLRATGEPVDNIYYWIDAAHVRGKDGDRRLRGWGIDIGSLYQVELPLAPFLITSFAVGSGDKTPESSTDTSFRQTGLQGNGAKFRSATEIQYYGELLNPELSNLLIFTTGMGMRPLPNATLIVLYHIYRQYAPSEALREAAIDVELTGESRDLGREVDVMGVWAIDNVEFKLVFGAFFPGSAFPAKAEMAFFSQLRMKVTF